MNFLLLKCVGRYFVLLAVTLGSSHATAIVDACCDFSSGIEWQQSKTQANCESPQNITTVPNAWRNLVPLHSTRAEVERLLGKAEWSHGFTYIYKTNSERIDVLYSAGCCEVSGVERWNVPADTVLRMEVVPHKTTLIQDLHLDQKKYVRIQEAHPENWIMYWNTEDGMMVHAILKGENEEVMSITYQPRAKDKPLRCR